MNYLYLVSPEDNERIQPIGMNFQPKLTIGTLYRWVCQPSQDWFRDSLNRICWVFQVKEAIENYETAPDTYPNGQPLVDEEFDKNPYFEVI